MFWRGKRGFVKRKDCNKKKIKVEIEYMRIGIDARIFGNSSFGGIARSVYNIISYWMKDYSMHEYYLIGFNKTVFDEEKIPANWHIVIKEAVINTGAVWYRTVLPKIIKELNINVYWGTSYTLPPKIKGVKMVLTIYDLAILHFKGIGVRRTEIGLKLFGKSNCLKADQIVAISNATKKDIMDLWKIDSNKITVSYCGGPQRIEANELSAKEGNNVSDKISNPYFLFVGTFEPRKNIPTIIRAFERYCETNKCEMDLVLCGKRGWRCDDIYEMIEKSKFSKNIKVFGYINDIEKEYLIENARIFLYPSLYEGFGIPILEAMQYNIPVITSNISSMPEVGGDAAFYINSATDFIELENKMEQVMKLTDIEKEQLKEKMAKQICKFSWQKNAEEMIKIITSL